MCAHNFYLLPSERIRLNYHTEHTNVYFLEFHFDSLLVAFFFLKKNLSSVDILCCAENLCCWFLWLIIIYSNWIYWSTFPHSLVCWIKKSRHIATHIHMGNEIGDWIVWTHNTAMTSHTGFNSINVHGTLLKCKIRRTTYRIACVMKLDVMCR